MALALNGSASMSGGWLWLAVARAAARALFSTPTWSVPDEHNKSISALGSSSFKSNRGSYNNTCRPQRLTSVDHNRCRSRSSLPNFVFLPSSATCRNIGSQRGHLLVSFRHPTLLILFDVIILHLFQLHWSSEMIPTNNQDNCTTIARSATKARTDL